MTLFKKDLSVNANCSIAERTSVAFGSAGANMPLYVVTLYFLYFCTDYLGLNSAIVGTIFLVTKMFDGVSDLVMGTIIDRTKSKMGKARVWILRGCIPYGIASILLFTIPTSVPSAVTYVYVFVAYNLVNTITFTCCCLSVNTLNCLMTQNAYERGILGIFNMFGTVAGQTIINTFTLRMLAAFGDDRKAWVIVVAIYAGIAVILQLLCVRGVTERVTLYGEETEKKETVSVIDSLKALLHNKYWIMFTVVYTLIQIYAAVFMASLVYYCTVCMGNANYMSSLANGVTIFQLIALMLSFILIKRFGKAKTFNIGVVGMLVAMVIKAVGGDSFAVQMSMSALHGFTMGIASSVVSGMCSDTVEYGEWKTGVRTEGVAFGSMSLAAKIGGGLGSAILGWLLVLGGYDASAAVQSASDIFAIKAGYNYIPFISCAIMLVIMAFYKLDKEYPQIIKELEERKKNQNVTEEG